MSEEELESSLRFEKIPNQNLPKNVERRNHFTMAKESIRTGNAAFDLVAVFVFEFCRHGPHTDRRV